MFVLKIISSRGINHKSMILTWIVFLLLFRFYFFIFFSKALKSIRVGFLFILLLLFYRCAHKRINNSNNNNARCNPGILSNIRVASMVLNELCFLCQCVVSFVDFILYSSHQSQFVDIFLLPLLLFYNSLIGQEVFICWLRIPLMKKNA